MHIENSLKRFWNQVDKTGQNDCWFWKGRTYGLGYGKFECKDMNNKKSAHRFSYILHKGPIPEDMIMLHSCDNPPCVNPEHLSFGTSKDNAQDREKKGRGDIKTARAARKSEHFHRGDAHWARRMPEKLKHGSSNPSAKLTEDNVRDIRKRLAEGERGTYIAIRYNIAHAQISAIKHGRTWSHVK